MTTVVETVGRIQMEDGSSVSCLWTGPEGAEWTLIYAPGAGSNLRDPFGAYAAPLLADAGIGLMRFQFPYSEAGRKSPDRPEVLEATWRAALSEARNRSRRIVAGGRSMGGRMASRVVAAGERVDALALFAYPLHPPGKPEERRVEHLPAITVPTLFCSGDRDNFGTVRELAEAVALVPDAGLHVLAGADHGFSTLKASGRRRVDVWQEAVEALQAFLRDIE
jgi:predicted alpha/beta-hydrolase family hydrolase